MLTFDDITRLVAAQRNAAWKDVARRIAHEIKNPLTPIQLSAERLRRKYRKEMTGDLETFDRCTDTIIRQVGDIGRMVDEFSAFARMPAPKFAEHRRRRTAAPGGVRPASRRSGNPDRDDGRPSGEVGLLCDVRMIGQALTNLLKNAGEAIAARRGSGAHAGTDRGAAHGRGRLGRVRDRGQRRRAAGEGPRPADRALRHHPREGHRPWPRHRRADHGGARRRARRSPTPPRARREGDAEAAARAVAGGQTVAFRPSLRRRVEGRLRQ